MPHFIDDNPSIYAHWTTPDGKLIKIRSSPEMDAVLQGIIQETNPDKVAAMGFFLRMIGDRAIEIANQMRADSTPH